MMDQPSVAHDWLTAVHQVVSRLETAWLPPVTPGEDDFYPWVSLPEAEFLPSLYSCLEITGPKARFLDAGCGIGTKLVWAWYAGFQVAGLERHEPYAEVARRLVPEADVMVGDAFDFDGYDTFDVVYSYRLCKRDDDQAQFNELLVSRMRPGALLFLAGTKLDREPVGDQVWRV